jgi:ABC-type branched-subunit amino acid transport system ATPase component
MEDLVETIRGFAAEGTALLVQKLGVATALAERQLVMVGGQIAAETTAPDAQRRYLGVEPIATEE